jgi:hypothetical protein
VDILRASAAADLTGKAEENGIGIDNGVDLA